MLPDVYPHDILVILYLVHYRRYYDPVQMPWWKIEFDEKINGQIYDLVPAFLKVHSPLDIVQQTKV